MKIKLIIGIFVGFVFTLSYITYYNPNPIASNFIRDYEFNENVNEYKENLKSSKISGKIHIDNNWTDVKAAGICTGNGIDSDPFVIENLIIDADGSGSGILIENSDVYVTIRNCTLQNSGFNMGGIRLSYVSNVEIFNITSSSQSHGISLFNSDDNIVSGNLLSDNTVHGILITQGSGNDILGNTVSGNLNGIYVHDHTEGIISGNVVENNFNYGIYLKDNDQRNTISGNNISNNYYGIYLYFSDKNLIQSNIITNNNFGIYIYYSNFNSLSNNIYTNNGVDLRRFGEDPQTPQNPENTPLQPDSIFVIVIIVVVVIFTSVLLLKGRQRVAP
ncbi:MAG: right-handed parallel beta-helix repeat-containing protein [Promethearchaeota archaeon]